MNEWIHELKDDFIIVFRWWNRFKKSLFLYLLGIISVCILFNLGEQGFPDSIIISVMLLSLSLFGVFIIVYWHTRKRYTE